MILEIDNERFAKAGLIFTMDEHSGVFHEADENGQPGEHWTARVEVVDGKLSFYPQRSAGQREVLARLGINVSDQNAA